MKEAMSFEQQERDFINDIRSQKSKRIRFNDENLQYDQRNLPNLTVEDENELLKKMHRQAQMNMKAQPSLRAHYNRRAGNLHQNENFDPLAQYKPSS